MKVGVVADGQAEVIALRDFLSRLDIPGLQVDIPLYADMQPHASAAQIVRAAEGKVAICNQRGCHRVVILIDHETRDDCHGQRAAEIERAFSDRGIHNISVVIKGRTFENWLIADLGSVRARHGRKYDISDNLLDRVRRSGADNLPAHNLLNECTAGEYCKRRDATEICRVLSPLIVAMNSRSFRKLLRTLGHPSYANQSRIAA